MTEFNIGNPKQVNQTSGELNVKCLDLGRSFSVKYEYTQIKAIIDKDQP